jgi:hypothetical protein
MPMRRFERKITMTEHLVPPTTPLTIDDLNAMPMADVKKLIENIEGVCVQVNKDLKVYTVNMQLIQKFIKDKFPV